MKSKPRPAYPFVPKSTSSLEPGQFWGIRLRDGRYGCGVVLSRSIDRKGKQHTRDFFAGAVDWIGSEPPTAEAIIGKKFIKLTEVHLWAITKYGTPILGTIPVPEGQPKLYLGRWGEQEVYRGAEFLREATPQDLKSLHQMGSRGAPGFVYDINQHFKCQKDESHLPSGKEVAAAFVKEWIKRKSKDLSYPLNPRSTNDLVPGQFWGIPLADGRYACGRVVSLESASYRGEGKSHAWFFLAGLMDWIGNEPPTAEAIAGRKVIATGRGHMDVILEHGRRLLGFRPLAADGNLPPVVVENGALRLGLEIIRTATRQDEKDFPEVESDDWEHHGICDEIKKCFGAKVVHGANKRAPLPPKLAVKKLSGVDEKALRILLGVHWEKGWKRDRTITPAEFEHAFKAGLMFRPMKLGHDDAISRLKRACREVTPQMVAHAFVASLSSRRLDMRSALGSFARWRHVPAHRYDPLDAKAPNTTWCLVCGNSNV